MPTVAHDMLRVASENQHGLNQIVIHLHSAAEKGTQLQGLSLSKKDFTVMGLKWAPMRNSLAAYARVLKLFFKI